jgi:hypothetical protein
VEEVLIARVVGWVGRLLPEASRAEAAGAHSRRHAPSRQSPLPCAWHAREGSVVSQGIGLGTVCRDGLTAFTPSRPVTARSLRALRRHSRSLSLSVLSNFEPRAFATRR